MQDMSRRNMSLVASAAEQRDGRAPAGAPATSANMLPEEVLNAAVQEVIEERDSLQEDLDEARRTIRLQHIAAKALGIFYCMELHALRRQCREYEEETARMVKEAAAKKAASNQGRRMSTVMREQNQGLQAVLKQL